MPVNSVPRFENAWMQRSKFPYTARSSAKVIRHAVSIDERRAKFRQDLISEAKQSKAYHHRHHGLHHRHHGHSKAETNGHLSTSNDNAEAAAQQSKPDRYRRPSQVRPHGEQAKQFNTRQSMAEGTMLGDRLTMKDRQRLRSMSPGIASSRNRSSSAHTAGSHLSLMPPSPLEEDEDELDEKASQDIDELW
ncbi:MAG: hypothetical protein Q9190_007446 [Brigantiaea leucoxantha]